MPAWLRWQTLLSIALVGVVFSVTGCGERAPRLHNGDPAPVFSLKRLDGGEVTLQGLRGRVVAIRFWADWCPYCETEMQELEPIYQELKGQGLTILAVNVAQESRVARAFLGGLDVSLSYTILLDPQAEVTNRYGVIGLPTTFFVDRQGEIQGKILGESEPEHFRQMVMPLL